MRSMESKWTRVLFLSSRRADRCVATEHCGSCFRRLSLLARREYLQACTPMLIIKCAQGGDLLTNAGWSHRELPTRLITVVQDGPQRVCYNQGQLMISFTFFSRLDELFMPFFRSNTVLLLDAKAVCLAYPEPTPQPPAEAQAVSQERSSPTPIPTSDPPAPDVNPFVARAKSTERPAPPVPSSSTPFQSSFPPVLPPKPSTNPFLARRASEDGSRQAVVPNFNTSTLSRARTSFSAEGRTPPLPPRKPVIPVPPPRHSSLVPVGRIGSSHHPLPPTTHPNVLIQQSLQATRVAQSLKRAEQRLEQERVLEVLKSSSGGRRTHSISPQDGPSPASSKSASVASSADRDRTEIGRPALPPRRRFSPPASTTTGSARSFEQVARATVHPFRPPSTVRSAPAATDTRYSPSPSRTPPRPLTELPPEPPPTHPDRTRKPPAGLERDAQRSHPPSPDPDPGAGSGSGSGSGSPRVFRSRSMHQPAPPRVPPPPRRRPDSVAFTPSSSSSAESTFASPVQPSFPSAAGGLSRHSSLSARPRERDGAGLSEPIANLQRTLSNLQLKAAPRLDAARYKAEGALSRRGFLQHSQPGARWLRKEGEERLIDGDGDGDGDGDDDEAGVGRDDGGLDVDGGEGSDVEGSDGGGGGGGGVDADEGVRRAGVERDELKWPAGEGWKRL
ncbi:hypothetical protein AcV5_000035 [Taiwanofungus camphoratus]|nr:hypothetical protein AcV5_000035 [Antrodia cinnamomea]